MKRNANAVVKKSAFPESNKGAILGAAKAAPCRASNAFSRLTAKINPERQIHEWSVSFGASFAFRARAGCGCAAA